jgi:hypothetical protein
MVASTTSCRCPKRRWKNQSNVRKEGVNIEIVFRARFEKEKGIFGIAVHLIFLRWMGLKDRGQAHTC